MKSKKGYVASFNAKLPVSREMADLLERRTSPFLDSTGMERPIKLLLQEAYLQGMRDALDVLRSGSKT